MKKLLCLMMSVLLLFSFAACGGDSEGTGSNSSTDIASVTVLKFDAESYTIGIAESIELSKYVIVEPAGTKLNFTSDNAEVANIYNATTGDYEGAKTGETTVTVTAGSLTATCKLIVAGKGTVVARNEETKEGGITNKRWGAVERPDDAEAKILIISKNLAEGTDMSNAVALNFGENFAAYYDGYYVARTSGNGNYELKDIPEGEYVGLIVSSHDYTPHKTYSRADAVATFKASAMGKYFTDAEIDTLVGSFFNREFVIKDLTVKANEINIFGNLFQPDLEQ